MPSGGSNGFELIGGHYSVENYFRVINFWINYAQRSICNRTVTHPGQTPGIVLEARPENGASL